MNTAAQNFASKTIQKIKFVTDKSWQAFEKLITLLGGRTIAMLAVALLITMVSVLYSDNWILSIKRQDAVISHIRNTIVILQDIKTKVYKAESAQRGYLYTSRADYLEPFNNALNEARENVRKVETMIVQSAVGEDQMVVREWMKIISASLAAKTTEMQVTVNLVKSGKHEEAMHVVNLDDGLVETRIFMDHVDTVIKNQTDNLQTRINERGDTILIARLSIFGGALILIWLVVLVIKQLLEEIAIKSALQDRVQKENIIYEEKLQQQTKLLRSLALDYQADVERERQKLSRELHDELGSIFTATKMDIAWVMKKMKTVAPEIGTEVIDKLRKTSTYVDQGIQYQRHIVQELHPSMLSTFGFWPALQSLINDAAERNQWELTLNLPDENTKLNQTLSLVAYRIVQETLNNANKYAKATKVSVDVIMDEKFIKLEIEDNGTGFDASIINGNTHGLSGMRHRVLAIGGHFEIISSPGQGVLTRALIPIDFEES
ncbi:MAG: CHASE3 domain-containing protein [Pseudomonadota bacterium]